MSQKFNPNFTDIVIYPSKFDGALAYGRFQVAGIMWVNFTLKTSNNGGSPWVALPYKSKGQGKGGTNEVSMITDEVNGLDAKKELEEWIVSVYEEKIASAPAPSAPNPLSEEQDPEKTPIPF